MLPTGNVLKLHKLKVDIGNALPMFEIPLAPVIDAWRVAEELFKDCDYLESSITLDVTDILEVLDILADYSQERADRRSNHRASRGLSPFGSELTIIVRGPAAPPRFDQLIPRFLENLYLAMNLSVPGSCNLYRTSFKSTRNYERSVWRRRRETIRLDLAAQPFEGAALFAVERGWPTHQPIDLRRTWKWLNQTGLLALDVGESPWQRAVFTLLRIGNLESQYPDAIFYCVQSIEALVSEGVPAPASVTKRRVESVLGVPRTHKNWFSDLQRIRSQVAHGTAPLVRLSGFLNTDPGNATKKSFENIDLSVAVLLALLQRLIAKDATRFQITEVIDLC